MWGLCCFCPHISVLVTVLNASRPTYLIYIFWSCVPAVQTVKERAGTECPNCTAACGKGVGLLFQRVDSFKDEAPLQLSAALCEITGCGYTEARGIRPYHRGASAIKRRRSWEMEKEGDGFFVAG